MSFDIAQKTFQEKKRVTEGGGVHGALKSPQTQKFNSPAPVIQRKPSCACGGGCPRCRNELSIQTKLKIGEPGDKYEQEADRVAEQVMRMAESVPPLSNSAPRPVIQRQTGLSEASIEQQQEEEEEEESILQTKSLPGGIRQENPSQTPQGTRALEGAIARMRRSKGMSLSTETRSFMEPRFRNDFSGVRVHDDGTAGSIAQRLNARAFTLGNEIFFGRGELQPHTDGGRRLLAHELTHVIQQTGFSSGAPLDYIQCAPNVARLKDDKDEPPDYIPKGKKKKVGFIRQNKTSKTIHLPELSLPTIVNAPKGTAKAASGGIPRPGQDSVQPLVTNKPFTLKRPTKRDDEAKASQDFRRGISESKTKSKIEAEIVKLVPTGAARADLREKGKQTDRPIHYMVLPSTAGHATKPQILFVGTVQKLRTKFLVPTWDKAGELTSFDADHAHELQLGGADDFENLWLWEFRANRSSGSKIKNQIEDKFYKLMAEAKDGNYWHPDVGGRRPTLTQARSGNIWTLVFDKVRPGLRVAGNRKQFWKRKDVQRARHIGLLKILNKRQAAKLGLERGVEPRFIRVFPSPEGGVAGGTPLDPQEGVKKKNKTIDNFFAGFNLKNARFELERIRTLHSGAEEAAGAPPKKSDLKNRNIGTLQGEAFGNVKKAFTEANIDLDLLYSPDLGFNAYIRSSDIRKKLEAAAKKRETAAPQQSPIEITEAGIGPDGVLRIAGAVTPEQGPLRDMSIPFSVDGNSLFTDVPVKKQNLNFGPLEITETSLRVGANKKSGFFYEGAVHFNLPGIANGAIEAQGLDFFGTLNLDLDFFSPAEVKVQYVNKMLSAHAKLGVKEGVLPGIKSADVNLEISQAGVRFQGTLEISAPGIPEGSRLKVDYDPAMGLLTIDAHIPLAADKIPGIKEGGITITAIFDPEGQGLSFKGWGQAELDESALPGVSGGLRVEFDDRILTFESVPELAVQTKNLDGHFKFKVTNQLLDTEGNPVGGGAADFRAFGDGRATLQIGRILTGGVGLEVTPEAGLRLTEASLKADIVLPLTRERTLFSKGVPPKPPWWIFNKILKGIFRIRGIPIPWQASFGVKAGFKLALLPVELRASALVNLVDFFLDPAGVKMPAFTIDADLNDPLIEATASATARGRLELGRGTPIGVGIEFRGSGTANIGGRPNIHAHIENKAGKLMGSLDLGISLGAELEVKAVMALLARALKFSERIKFLDKTFGMENPFQWDHTWTLEMGSAGSDVEAPAFGSVPVAEPTPKQIAALEKDFDASNDATESPDQEVTSAGGDDLVDQLERLSKVIELFSDLANIFLLIWEPIDHLFPPNPSKIAGWIGDAPDKGEQLIKHTTRFYEGVQAAEKEGTLTWLEEKIPGGKAVVAALKAYLWSVEKTYEGISSVAGSLGFHDPVAFEKAFNAQLKRSDKAFNEGLKKRPRLMREGFDRVTAETVTHLEFVATTHLAKSIGGVTEMVQARKWEAECRARIPKSLPYARQKKQELIAKGIPEELASEIARIHRLDFVNVTGNDIYLNNTKAVEDTALEIQRTHADDEVTTKAAIDNLIGQVRPGRIYHEGG